MPGSRACRQTQVRAPATEMTAVHVNLYFGHASPPWPAKTPGFAIVNG